LKRISLQQWKIILLSSLGGMLDYYDFVIFAIFAKTIGQTFFPSHNPLMEVFAAFSAFAVGYLARPLGGIVFSHFGDKYGRRQAFIFSILIMGLATFGMAVVPSYQRYGILMPILFLFLRFIQGIALGGEISGALTFVSEHVKHRVGLACAVIFCFVNFGVVAATLVKLLLSTVEPIMDSGVASWRVAFGMGGLFAILSYFLRTNLEESPEFLAFKHEVPRVPILELLRSHLTTTLLAVMLVAVNAVMISMLYLYTSSFMELLGHFSPAEISQFNFYCVVLLSAGILIWGYLVDRIGARRVFLTGIVLIMPLSYGFYSALLNNSYLYLFGSLIPFVSGMINASFPVLVVNLFPTSIRYSGVATSYNLAFAVFCGLSPLLATALIERTGNWMMPVYVLIVVSLLGMFSLVSMGKGKRELD
jgi:MFS transporter, MHS family, proline/betaine transporter